MSEGKGLFALFGGAAAPPKPIKKAEDIKTKEELAREAAFALANKKKQEDTVTTGGGAWKTATKRGSRGLALKARAMGKAITVKENKNSIPDDEEDIAMGGMGKKKKR